MTHRRGLGPTLRQMARPEQGRLVAGVCLALASRLALDVTLLRLAFLLLVLASGAGLILYLALWLLLPQESQQDREAREFFWDNMRGLHLELHRMWQRLAEAWARTGTSRWPRPLTRRWIALGLVILGSFIFLCSVGLFDWLGTWRIIGLVTVVLGVAVLVQLGRG